MHAVRLDARAFIAPFLCTSGPLLQAGKQLPCSHAMHSSCLVAWLQQSRTGNFTCPLCRASLDMQLPLPKPAEHARWLEAGVQHLESGLQRLGDGIERLVAPTGPAAAHEHRSTSDRPLQSRAPGRGRSCSPHAGTADSSVSGSCATAEPADAPTAASRRPFTRLQARLAAAGNPAAPAGGPAAAAIHQRSSRRPRRIDCFMD